MAKPKITMVQEFTYRDAREEWSNSYHFLGPAPGDDASWKALADALILHLKPCFTSDTHFVETYGYTDGENPSVWSHDYRSPGPPPQGTFTNSPVVNPPGDTAAWLRWPTDKRNSKGKVVYLRKYFHGIQGLQGDKDKPDTANYSAIFQFGLDCINGNISSVFHVCTPDGHPGLASQPGDFFTTRTLKRRGKRPPT